MVIRSGTLFSVHPGSAYRSDRGEGWLTVLAVDKDYDLIAEVTGQPAETLPAHPARPDSRLLPHEGSARTRFRGVSQGHGCDREDQEGAPDTGETEPACERQSLTDDDHGQDCGHRGLCKGECRCRAHRNSGQAEAEQDVSEEHRHEPHIRAERERRRGYEPLGHHGRETGHERLATED